MLAENNKKIKGILKLIAPKILRGTQRLGCVHEVLRMGTARWDIKSKALLRSTQHLFTFHIKHEWKRHFMLP